MQKPIQIGITGGIGSGKSLVCKIFTVLGIPVYDADSRAKAVMTTDGILVEAIKKEFGTLSYKSSGELNREYLSKSIFSDQTKLKKLNALVHPRVAVDYENWLSAQQDKAYVIKEAALLFESGSYKILDAVMVVHTPEQLRIQRIMARDKHRSEEEVRNIIRNQLSENEKQKLANYRVENDEKHSLVKQVLTLHQQFLLLAKNKTHQKSN